MKTGPSEYWLDHDAHVIGSSNCSLKKIQNHQKKHQSESAQLYNKDFRSKLANTSEQVNAILKDHKDHSFKTGI